MIGRADSEEFAAGVSSSLSALTVLFYRGARG